MTDWQQPSIFIRSDQGSIFRRSFPEKKVFQLTGRKITRPDRRLDDGDDEDDGQGDQHQVQGRKHGGPKNEVNTEKSVFRLRNRSRLSASADENRQMSFGSSGSATFRLASCFLSTRGF